VAFGVSDFYDFPFGINIFHRDSFEEVISIGRIRRLAMDD